MRECDVAALVPNPFASTRTEEGEGQCERGKPSVRGWITKRGCPCVWIRCGQGRNGAETEVSEADLYLQIARRKDGGGRQTVSGGAV